MAYTATPSGLYVSLPFLIFFIIKVMIDGYELYELEVIECVSVTAGWPVYQETFTHFLVFKKLKGVQTDASLR